jgi:inosose dehydratase
MAINIGTAPDSWGVWFPSEPRQTPWLRFLDEVVEAGYQAIELGPFGYLPTEPQRVAVELARRSLQLSGGTISVDLSSADAWPDMRARLTAICDVLEHVGAHFLVVLDAAPANGSQELDEAGWRRLSGAVQRLGEYTTGRSIAAVFHPHGDTTIQFEPQIERFLASTDPALVNLCLDVGHHAYAGGDAVRFFREHHARVPYLHLKDVDAGKSRRAQNEGWSMSRSVAEGVFVDLGDGCVDLEALKHVAEEIGYDGWGIVEQDMFPAPFDKPLPIARRNRQFLRAHGIG